MRPIALVLALFAIVIAAIGAASSATPALAADRSANRSPATPATKSAPTWDDYRLIVERNIFLRDRHRPSAPRPTYTPSSSPKPPDPQMILCGVADQDGAPTAFFEDDQTGQITKLQVGQRIRGGSIVGVSLDGVDYQTASGIRRVAIGQTLSGATASLASTSPTTATATSAPGGPAATTSAAASSGTGDKAADDIAERMRQRRLAELGVTKAPSSSQPTTQDSSTAGSPSGQTPASSPGSSTSSPSSTGSSGI